MSSRRCGADLGQPLGDGLEALHLEAEVIDAAPVLAPLLAGGGIALELEDGEVDVPVAQEVSEDVGVDPADLLHAEHVGVEAGGALRSWVAMAMCLILAMGSSDCGKSTPERRAAQDAARWRCGRTARGRSPFRPFAGGGSRFEARQLRDADDMPERHLPAAYCNHPRARAVVGPALAQEAPRWPTPASSPIPARLIEVARGLEHPWGLAFLPDGRMLVTERPGRLRIVGPDGRLSTPLTGVPEVLARGQGGLLDVALSPALRRTGSCTCRSPSPGRTEGARRSREGASATRGLDDKRVIWRQEPKVTGGNHWGSRLVFRSGRHALRDAGRSVRAA